MFTGTSLDFRPASGCLTESQAITFTVDTLGWCCSVYFSGLKRNKHAFSSIFQWLDFLTLCFWCFQVGSITQQMCLQRFSFACGFTGLLKTIWHSSINSSPKAIQVQCVYCSIWTCGCFSSSGLRKARKTTNKVSFDIDIFYFNLKYLI